MKRKFRGYEEGGLTYGEDERPAPTGMGGIAESAQEEVKPKTFREAFAEARAAGDKAFTWQGKRYSTEMAGSSRSSAPVAGRPRGESYTTPSATRSMMDRAAEGARSAREASESRASKARQSDAEMRREARGQTSGEPKAKRLSTAGLNPKTLLPERGYAKGGSVRGDGICQRGHTKGTMR